ncbi:hypothetical protein [Gemmatimonas sp. UBA7669]|uniref:hypothetical protein n=1 Tax=Gemmatimonas sp. UBA7669 TaxID=1946568 RepID=UPI0025B9335D|nr:hypothetical protein [Gemmatimonas sp. UBA7669]
MTQRKSPLLPLLLAVALLVPATRASAQTPTVKDVYDRFATAVGGRDAWVKVTGRTEKGTTDVTFAGLSGFYERHSALPNKIRMIIDLGMVKIDQGFDGEKGWIDQGQGVQRMPEAEEKRAAEAAANDGAAFLDHTRFAKASVDGKEQYDGVESYKVSTTSKGGTETVEYFDVSTGFRVGSVTKGTNGEARVIYRDYKEFEGKKVPTKIVQVQPQGDVVITIQLVTFGAPDPAVFKSPLDK